MHARLRPSLPVVPLLVVTITVAGCAPRAVASPAGTATAAASTAAGGGTTAAVPLLIDTDVAADDLVAIAFLVASPEVDIRAITVSGTGEAHCAPGVDVVLRLLERLDAPPIPVACGRETPLAGIRAFPDAWREHVDGGAGLELPATSREPFDGSTVELIAKSAGGVDRLRVLTLGPLTNLAEALLGDPALGKRLESVYAMGGAVRVPGNVSFAGPSDNLVAEWNIYVDPTAAQAVIDSGVPVRLVSLDGTSQVPVTQAFAARIEREGTGPGARVLADLFAANPFMAAGSYYLWDPLAAGLAAGHPLGTFTRVRIDVEEADGPEAGFTRPVEGTPNAEYLSSADATAAEDVLARVLNR